MSAIALTIGDTALYWSGLVIALAAAAWLALSLSLYTARGGHSSALWVLFPFALVFSVLLARFLHWYCHSEQYAGFLQAMSDLSSGGYCMPGLLLGVFLAALLVWLLRLAGSLESLLDAMAPGAALGIGLIRLSALFGNACRGKLVISDPRFQHLPFAAPVIQGSGGVEYRFATFFASFLLLMLLAMFLLRFQLRQRARPMRDGSAAGDTARMFLLFYSAMELVLDSSRYDSSFLRSNGFVSMVQIFSAVCILGLLIYYSRRSLRFYGLQARHIALWLLWLAGLGAGGYLEYLVQRHGDWYLMCYTLMGFACLLMALAVWGMYRTLRRRRKDPKLN